MKRLAFLTLLFCLMCGCRTVDPLSTYERDELVAVQHNQESAYTLLVYRDPMGQTRHVLRKNGVTQLVITYTLVGEIELKERGVDGRKIGAIEANRVTKHINALLSTEKGNGEKLSSMSI